VPSSYLVDMSEREHEACRRLIQMPFLSEGLFASLGLVARGIRFQRPLAHLSCIRVKRSPLGRQMNSQKGIPTLIGRHGSTVLPRTARRRGALGVNFEFAADMSLDDLRQRSTAVGCLPDYAGDRIQGKKVESTTDMIIISPPSMREAMAELLAMYIRLQPFHKSATRT
jgi:hypothetical protein